MNTVEYVIYWTMSNGQPASAKHTELNAAIKHAELHRRQGMRFVTMCSENSNSIGQSGVDSVVDGKTPDGEDYTWSKQHRAGATRGVPYSIIDHKSNGIVSDNDIKLLPNQLFGLGSGSKIDLFCRVDSISSNGVKFTVINGAWEGLLRPDSVVVVYTPGGAYEIVITKQYLDPVPKFKNEYYNEAIDWMNGSLTGDISKYLYKDLPASYFADMNDDIPF